jgi:hypothetical protein
MNKEHNYEGGLFNYIVLKEEKEVIFYLHNPYPDCLKIPDIMKQRFPSDYKSIVVNSLDNFKKVWSKTLSTKWDDTSWQKEFLNMKAHSPSDAKLLMGGVKGLKGAWRLGVLHVEYERLKKIQEQQQQ